MQIYLLLMVLAGIVAMDTTAGPQILISEPVASCTLVGFLFGKPEMGFMIGMLFQLIWFDYMPLGAVRFTDSNMAALISTVSLFSAERFFGFTESATKVAIIPALLYGVATGFIGLYLTTQIRHIRSRFSESIVFRLERGEKVSVAGFHLAGLSLSFLRGVFMALLLIPAGTIFCGLLTFLPVSFVGGLSSAIPMMWGTACAAAFTLYWIKGDKKPLLLGVIGGFVWVLMIIGRHG